jgi:UDP-glucose 4-epimerase
MHSAAAVGQVVNIGNDQEVSILQLAEMVKAQTGSSSPISFIPYDQAYAPGFEDMARRVPSLEKLVRLIDFRPTTRLELIIQSVIDYSRTLRKPVEQPVLAHSAAYIAMKPARTGSGRFSPAVSESR